jgi:hypothetical protein
MQTQGFQLSQFERAPQISGDIGKVDVKGIYDNVVNALKTYEATASSPARQAATEAGLNYETQKAQTDQGLLGVEGEARRSKANLLSADSNASLGLLSDKTNAARAGYASDTAKGNYFATPGVWESFTQAKIVPKEIQTKQAYARMLDDPNATELDKAIALQGLGQKLTANQEALINSKRDYVKTQIEPNSGRVFQFGADGSSRILGEPGSEVGAFRGGAPAPAPQTSPSPAQATVTPAVFNNSLPSTSGLTLTPTPTPTPTSGANPYTSGGLQAIREKTQTDKVSMENIKAENRENAADRNTSRKFDEDDYKQAIETRKALDTDYNALQNLETKSRLVDSAINQAIIVASQNGMQATGGGPVGAGIRATKLSPATAKFQSLLTQIRSNVGFDTLQQMRQNSKTGGALGNVSDNEGVRLESVFGNLNQDLSDKDMIDTLVKIREARREFLKQSQEAYKRAKEQNEGTINRIRPELAKSSPLEKDADAIQWAHKNPNDPRAAKILEHATNQ